MAFNINVSEANKKYKVIIKGFAIPGVKKHMAETKEEILELFRENLSEWLKDKKNRLS